LKKKTRTTRVLEEEPIRALARAPKGLDEEEEPGTAQAAPPVTSSRIAIFFFFYCDFEEKILINKIELE
jgi:hypothetical protein